MDRRTGKVITGWSHLVQSVDDILTTRVLSRVMRREYGADGLLLVDQPMNEQTLMAFYARANDALTLWEPRFKLRLVSFVKAGPDGVAEIVCTGDYYPRGHLGDYSIVETDRILNVLVGVQ